MIKNRKGFTLIEIIIVVAVIITIISAIGYSTHKIIYEHKIKALKSNQELILNALDLYKQDNGHYPANKDEFNKMINNKHYCPVFPNNPFWNKNKPEDGWYYDPDTLTVVPVSPSSDEGV